MNNSKLILFSLMTFLTAPLVYADIDLHPKIAEGLNRERLPEGFIFDVQSNNNNYYSHQLEYISQQIFEIHKRSNKFRIILLSRGYEMNALAKNNYGSPVYNVMSDLNRLKNLEIQVDIEVAFALGFTENSFPSFVKILRNSYITIVSGKSDDMIVIELQRMTLLEQEEVKVSPTWRTDPL